MSETAERVGSFTIERELGTDSLGVWLRARDGLDRTVALRVWRLPGPLARLREPIRERARKAAGLAHPNLPTVYGREELESSDLLSVEYIEGETLATILESGARWRPLDAARLVIHIADALAVAHDSGLVHGRIGPDVVRLTSQGRPVLLELGVARSEAEAGAPLADGGLKSADVSALAALLRTLAAPGPQTADPMHAVEMRLLEPILAEASRNRSRRLPDAGFLRDALTRIVTPGGGAHRSQPAEERDPLSGSMPRPRNAPGTGSLSVLLPVEREPSGAGRPSRRIAAGVLFGAVVAALFIALRVGGPGFGDDARYAIAPGEGLATSPPVVPPTPAPATERTAAPDSMVQPAEPRTAADDTPVDPQPAAAETTTLATPPPAAPPRPGPTRSARVTVSPPDAVITRASDGDYLGMGQAEVAVQSGETTVLEFARNGYVPQRRPFTGDPLQVFLVSDSVDVTFQSNVPVDVVLETPQGPVTLGRTNLSARLPTGQYRIRFASDLYPEWSTTSSFPQAGGSYRVTKMDYPTRGALVIAVPSGWANVSVNGSPPRESPARFDDLPDFPHVVRLSRDGYETIIDTVRVVPGQVTTRQYRLQPVR